jgi:uncharacterized membrane protein YdjX (TVP38/TMEM64 family)
MLRILKMSRFAMATVFSSVLMALAIYLNPDLYFFSKTTGPATWVSDFIIPGAGMYVLLLFALVPAVFLPKTLLASLKSIAVSAVFAPLPAATLIATGLLAGQPLNLGNGLWQYVWALALGCLPAVVVAAMIAWLYRRFV